MALPAGDFVENADSLHMIYSGGDVGKGRSGLLRCGSNREDRMRLGVVKYLQDGGCGPTKGFYFFTVGIQQGDQAARAEDRPFGSLLHARQKELDLYFPVPGGVNAREEIVIDLAIVFEIQTQVEDRLRQRAAATEQESDEKTSESSVAVEKWVESLELHMGQSGPNKKRQILSLRMEKHLELAHALRDEFGRWWNERRVAGSGSSDPVLAPAKLAGSLVASPSARMRDFVDLANET